MGKKITLLFLIGLVYLPVFGQSILEYASYWDQFIIRNYTLEDGLPGEPVTFSYEDDDGFIWLLSAFGLVRYDGLTLKPFDKGLVGGYMYETKPDSKGNIWIPAISKGLYKFNGDSLTQYLTELEAPNGLTKSITITQDDLIYLGIYGEGLFVFDGESVVKKYTTSDGLISNAIWRVMEDRNGKIWIGTDEGLSIFYEGTFTNFTTDNGLPYNTIRGITEMFNGHIWIGTDKEGIVVFENEKPIQYYTTNDGLSGNYPQFFAQSPVDSSIWIGDHGEGVDRFKDGTFENMNEKTGLVSNYVMYVGFTEQGMGIVGTENGVSIFTKKKIDVIDERIQGIENTPFINTLMSENGTVWLGTEGRGYLYHDGENWQSVDNPPTISNGYSNGAAVDNEGNVWFSTQGTGIIRINDEYEIDTHLTTEQGLAHNFVNGMSFDAANNLFLCTNSGVDVLNQNFEVVQHYDTSDGMTNEYCISSLLDSKERYWAGTYGGGLYKIVNGEITQYDSTYGLNGLSVYSIVEHSSGRLFVNTNTGGLYEYVNDRFNYFGADFGVPMSTLYSMVEDDDQNMWFTSSNGVYLIQKEELNKLTVDANEPISYTHYTTEDGLPTNNLEAAITSTSALINTGEILVASSNGVGVLNPKNMLFNSDKFSPYIDEFIVDESALSLTNLRPLTPNDKKIEITYSALNLEAPGKTRFRIKLTGIDEDWVFVDKRRSAYYDYLPDGDYTFHVSAIGPDGQWSNKTASMSFTVLPPFYKTWWFIGLCLLGFAGIVAGSVQWRNNAKVRLLNRELAYQQKIQQERERISRDLHDNVGSQITNIITGIEISNMHIQNADQDKASKFLETLDVEARNTMTDLRETIWLLDKEQVSLQEFRTHLKGYLNRQKHFLNGLSIETDIQEDSERILNPTESLNLMRIIQEALNNARKYAQANVFKISIKQDEQKLTISLIDNGQGMNIEEKEGIGNGLKNMKERATLIGATFDIESTVNVGTSIQIQLAGYPA